MISLSKLVKHYQVEPLEALYTISSAVQTTSADVADALPHAKAQAIDLTATHEEAQRIITQAKAFAEEQLRQIKSEKEGLLQIATAKIQQWWEQQRSEDEALRQVAQEEGYATGLQQATEQWAIQYVQRMKEVEDILTTAHRIKDETLESAQPFLVELSVAIAAKIVRQTIAHDALWMKPFIEEALHRLPQKDDALTIRVHPSSWQCVVDVRHALLPLTEGMPELRIVPDATLPQDGCLIQTKMGTIDATVDTQLATIKQTLLSVVDQRKDVPDA
jgi:flagellar assembly protein FliH